MRRKGGRTSTDRVPAGPPFLLAQAAADEQQMWCLDINAFDGRYVHVGTLASLEDRFSGVLEAGVFMDPSDKIHLFPIKSLSERIRYSRYAKYGRTKIGWVAPQWNGQTFE